MKHYRSTRIVIALIFSVLFFKGSYRLDPIHHLETGLKIDNVSLNKRKGSINASSSGLSN